MTAIRRISRLIPAPLVWLALLPASGCQDTGALEPHSASSALRAGNARVVDADLEARPVPFKGTVVAIDQVTDPTPPPGCELFRHVVLGGELNHLGRFTGTGTTCGFNVQVPVLDPPINPAGGPPPYLVTDFVVEHEYTAVNGNDVLRVRGTGVLVQSLADGSRGLVGVGTVQGGTGHFAGASGEFDVEGVFPEVRYDGWIVYDASGLPDD